MLFLVAFDTSGATRRVVRKLLSGRTGYTRKC